MENIKPIRIQRKRTKGWRMPENTVYVGRGSRWGNPYRTKAISPTDFYACATAKEAVEKYTLHILDTLTLEPLRGKDLACWCALDQPCHADFLLVLANA